MADHLADSTSSAGAGSAPAAGNDASARQPSLSMPARDRTRGVSARSSTPHPLRTGELADLLGEQEGVVARGQLVHLQPHDLRRLLRRRELVPVVPGVYVNHTGEPTWRQRAWAGVLHCWPAALAGESALRVVSSRPIPDTEPVHVAIDGRRSGLVTPDWMHVLRRRRLEAMVLWNLAPPRLRYEEALLDVALSASDDFEMIAALARGISERRTTAARLLDAVERRSKVPRRRFVVAVLRDIDEGACSALEWEFMVRIERAHGLPPGSRQRPVRGTYRDVDYGKLVVELDGRLFHDNAEQRDRDLDRDLDTAIDRQDTVRLGWGQVLRRPCRTTGKLVTLMEHYDMEVDPHPCRPGCGVGVSRAA